ncbi:hypothetical protein N8T08_000501 [Aspergillus melleus]|uniref:Uncharacterized protein n=1 Tax=Aspergillus melleus TaxID=138277 RepID=A0ACC3BCI5_9EURO|nr:hypothetical protein N8T08_000501 [Aspergillus melleus]
MGWFNSIVRGVGSAVNWAMSNAGDIAGLIKSVKKVSMLYIPKDASEETETSVTSRDYFKEFERAERVLQTRAENMVKAKKVKHDWDPPRGSPRTTDASLCGLWTSPSVFSSTSKEVPEMYRDLVKFFAESGVPALITIGGNKVDVAERVSQAIFPYSPEPPSQITSFDADDEEHFPQYGIALRDDDRSWQLFVGHAYYAIPMGRSGKDRIWHGAVHLRFIASDDVRQEHAAEMEEFRFMGEIEPVAVEAWLVTFQIAWKAVKVARGGYKFLKEVLNDENNKTTYKVTYNFLDGQLQTVKIQTQADTKSPSEIHFYLQEAVAEAVVKMNQSLDRNSVEIAAAATQYQTPRVYLTDSTLVTADAGVVDNLVVVSR